MNHTDIATRMARLADAREALASLPVGKSPRVSPAWLMALCAATTASLCVCVILL